MRVALPERWKAARRQRKAKNDVADLADREFLVLAIEDRETVAGNRAPGAAMTRAGVAKSDAGAKRQPAELGLPPMVDDRKAEHRLGPAQRVGIGALAGKIKRSEEHTSALQSLMRRSNAVFRLKK